MAGVVIEDGLLSEIVRRIVEAVDPDRLILFGLRARGDNRPDSDFDLLLVKESSQPKYKRAVPAHRSLTGIGPTPAIMLFAARSKKGRWCMKSGRDTEALP